MSGRSNKQGSSSQKLHWAAEKGGTRDIDRLLEQGHDLHATDSEKFRRTPVLRSAYGGNEQTYNHLLGKGANPNDRDHYGRSPFLLAAKQGHGHMVNDMIERQSVDVNSERDNWQRNALHLSTLKGKEAVVTDLVHKGACVQVKDNFERSPLHLAARDGRTDIAQTLLEKGAPVNDRDNWGRTPLHLAHMNHQSEMVDLLSKSGADQNIREKYYNCTPNEMGRSE